MFDSQPDADLDGVGGLDAPDALDAPCGDDDAFEHLLREAAHVPPLAIPMPERGILLKGRFEVIRQLGRGGMGVVYEVQDHDSGGRLALKSLSYLDASSIERLKHEFRSVSGVVHPNLVGLHELFFDGQYWFFTMDLVEGRDFLHMGGSTALSESAGRRTLTWRHPGFRGAMAQLVKGVQAIHDTGKLHRDLKPSNVLVTDAGGVVILDFGLVSDALDQDGSYGGLTATSPTRSAIRVPIQGTPAYMAPEQAARKPATAASDWYAVGVMLFQALSGRLPFEGTREQILVAKCQGRTPVLEAAEDLPTDLVEVCHALLQHDPIRRPTGEAILQVLGADGDHEEASAPPFTGPHPSQPPAGAFIGREAELQRLHAAFDEMAASRGGAGETDTEATVGPRIALVHGSSGVGKSALVSHFVETLQHRNSNGPRALVLSARCYEREAVPFKAFDGIIDELVAYLRTLPEPQAAALLPHDVRALACVFPVLGRVAAVARSARRWTPTDDPLELRARALRALRALLGNLACQAPLVLVIDDLQWSDVDSARMLEAIVAPPAAPQLLVIGVYRREDAEASDFLQHVLHLASPQERYRWRMAAMFMLHRRPLPVQGGEPQGWDLRGPAHMDPDAERATLSGMAPLVDVPVERLSDVEGACLARRLLADVVPVSDALVDRLARESAGIPFYVHELACHLRAQLLDGSSGPVNRIPGSPIVSLAEAFASRLEALPSAASEVLDIIAVAGRPIRQDLVLRAAGLPADDRKCVDLLRSLFLVRTRGSAYSDGAEVYHDRVRSQVIARMDAPTRKRRHACLARVLEADGSAHADWLAEQFQGAGMDEQAARFAAVAASESRGALAFGGADDLYRWASSLVRARYDAVVQRGTLRGTAAGALLGSILALSVLMTPREQGVQHQAVLVVACVIAGAVLGMVAGSVVTLLSVKDPAAPVPGPPERPVGKGRRKGRRRRRHESGRKRRRKR